jgi:uncharacterized membrane protein
MMAARRATNEESTMSELLCIAFDGQDTATQGLKEFMELQKEHIVEIEDACIVTRDVEGKVELRQAINLVGVGALSGLTSGMLLGGLVGLVFLNPLAGALIGGGVGAGTGALSGALADYGINDDFIKSVGANIPPQSSALFLLLRKATLDKIVPHLAGTRGRVLRTSLSDANEARLRQALGEAISRPQALPAGTASPDTYPSNNAAAPLA